MDPPPASNTTEYKRTLDDIIKEVERFRILIIGRAGVGKSSLINCVFGINNARVEDKKVGEADIEKEFVSTQNQYFVLHDSKGFEPGDISNFEIVRKFVEDRSKKQLLKERIHGLWLCAETPTAGGCVFETGDEKLLQFAHENRVPLVLVFTQHDRLVKAKELQLREKNLDPATLRQRSVEEAQEAFKVTLQSLQVTMDKLGIPMPTYARLSVRKGYEKDVSYLVRVTKDVAKDQVMGDAWLLWAMAQRAGLPGKIEACIIVGINYHVHALAGKVLGVREWTLGACLQKVHKDIITCWNFRGEVLESPKFQDWMLNLVDDVQIAPGAPNPNVDEVNQMVTLATSVSASIVPAFAALGLATLSVRWLKRTLGQNLSEAQRLLIAYIVDLIKVLIELFDITIRVELALTTTWKELQEACDAYKMSPSRQSIHESIRSKNPMLTPGEIRTEIRRLLEVD